MIDAMSSCVHAYMHVLCLHSALVDACAAPRHRHVIMIRISSTGTSAIIAADVDVESSSTHDQVRA